jgi:hypothetical protein
MSLVIITLKNIISVRQIVQNVRRPSHAMKCVLNFYIPVCVIADLFISAWQKELILMKWVRKEIHHLKRCVFIHVEYRTIERVQNGLCLFQEIMEKYNQNNCP